MTLILSIIKSPASVSLEETQKVFTEQGGSIGRGSSTSFVLADPDRFLSSNHCAISFSANRYYLTDTSTNGTFLNGSPEPVGKGVTVMLAHSDTIEVGDYQFRVDVDDVGLDQSPSGAGVHPTKEAHDPLDPFSAPMSTPLSESDSFGDPFSNSSFSESFSETPLDNIDAALEGETSEFTAVDPFAASGAFGSSHSSSAGDSVDPLAALDGVDLAAKPSDGSIEDNDFLGLSAEFPVASSEYDQGLSHNDGAGALQQSVSWPEPKNENVIPDDWDLPESADAGTSDSFGGGDAFGGQLESGGVPQNNVPQSHSSHQSQSKKVEELDPLDALLNERSAGPVPDPFRRPRQGEQPQPFQNPHRDAEIPSPNDSSAFDSPSYSNHNRQPKVNVTGPRRASAPEDSGAPSPQHHNHNGSVLLAAMGIDVSNLSRAEIDEIEQSVGELMPVIVAGMMQVLRSRTSIKNEFRMNVTTIQPVENNPLKFSADTSDAIENMFLRKSGAYKKPVQAFQEGFDGIGEHQVAIIAGIRAAFESMMNRFNPSQLEKQFDKYNKGVTLPGMQKAKYWNGYIDHYRGLVDNMENSFQYLFGDEFVQAYEDQLRVLVAERSRK